jgi:hypothetical protein
VQYPISYVTSANASLRAQRASDAAGVSHFQNREEQENRKPSVFLVSSQPTTRTKKKNI